MTSQIHVDAPSPRRLSRRRIPGWMSCLLAVAIAGAGCAGWFITRQQRQETAAKALAGRRASIGFASPQSPWWMQMLGLRQSSTPSRVTSLDWPDGTGTDNLLFELTELAGLEELVGLGVPAGEVTDKGLAHIRGLTTLRFLDLSKTRITDAGLRHLAGMTKLENLNLRGTHVTDAAIAELVKFTKLKALDVTDTGLTPAGIEELQQALPALVLKQ